MLKLKNIAKYINQTKFKNHLFMQQVMCTYILFALQIFTFILNAQL